MQRSKTRAKTPIPERRGAASDEFTGVVFAFLAACLCQARVPGCAPGGAVTFSCVATGRRPRESHQREGDPAVRVPFAALRGNLRCALQAGSAQTRLAAQTARGPDPPEAVLLGTARGEGEPGSPSGHRCARPRRRQRARRRQWRRIQRSAGIGGAVQLSDHDAAQRNACSDPNAGMVGAARVLCHSCFRPCIALEMMSDCCRP